MIKRTGLVLYPVTLSLLWTSLVLYIYLALWKWKLLSHDRLFVTTWTIQSMEFSRPEYWSWWPFPFPRDLPNPGIKPRSPSLQVDSLPAEPKGSPRILEWTAYPFSNRSSWPRNRTRVSCIAGRFFTSWAIMEAHLSL